MGFRVATTTPADTPSRSAGRFTCNALACTSHLPCHCSIARLCPNIAGAHSYPPRTSTVDTAVTPSKRRQHLTDRYQQAVVDDGPAVVCAYCGGALARIEVDHVHPQGQSGTDARNNLVFACSVCGARKGNRRPDAAGMPIRYGPVPTAILSNRARPYMRWTARLLQARLRNLGLSTWWGIAGEPLPLEEPLSAALCRFMEHPNLVRDPLIAHPVSRPRKQVFT